MDGGNQQAYDDCDQLELVFIPYSSINPNSKQGILIKDQLSILEESDRVDEVSEIRRIFEECNEMNPDSNEDS